MNWQKNALANSSGLIVDSLGNSYVASAGFNLEKRDASGALVWTKSNFGYTSGNIAFDRKGNVLAFATKTSTVGNLNDLYVGKYDTAGTLLWTTTIDFGSLNNILISLTVDYSNQIILTASTETGPYYYEFLTVRLDANGSVIWKKPFSYKPSASNNPISITCDSINSIYLFGYTSDTASFGNGDSLLIIKYDSLGNLVKTKNVTQASGGTVNPFQNDLKIFQYNKNIFYSTIGWPLSGPQNSYFKLHRTDMSLISDTIVFQNSLLQRLSFIPYPQNNLITIGGTRYTYSLVSSAYINTGIYDITYKMNMNNYSVTSYSTGSTFGSGTASLLMKNGNFLYSPYAYGSSVITVLSPSFTSVTSVTTITTSSSLGFISSAYSDINNDIYHLYYKSSSSSWFLNKYAITTNIFEAEISGFENLIYPNPAIDELNIPSECKNITKLEIFDMTGKRVYQPDVSYKLKIQDLNPGFYLLKVYESETSHSFKFLKQ